MSPLYFVALFGVQLVLSHSLNMRNTDEQQDGFCLLYYVHDRIYDFLKIDAGDKWETAIEAGSYIQAYQLIPYCFRPLEKNLFLPKFNNIFDSSYTFTKLQKENINSEQLLSWSASIDLVERYQIFLNNISYLSSSSENETLFYNCTTPWFGPFCLFTFHIASDKSFEEIVDLNFQHKSALKTYSNSTCYIHLSCETLVRCLDWRDICDKKLDCSDGLDELHCWQLELNKCTDNEYRCHNGQCVPIQFFDDIPMNPDCLDRTDERRHQIYPQRCHLDPAFRCEEHTCRPRSFVLPCGDGDCSWEFGFLCRNNRDKLFYSDPCSRSLACFMIIEISKNIDYKWCRNLSIENDYIRENCAALHEFSGGPILFGHVRLIYNITGKQFKRQKVLLPDYICYNEDLCQDFLPATLHLNNWTCRYFHQLGLKDPKEYQSFQILIGDIKNQFRKCLVALNDIHHCNHSTMYRCLNSSKCIAQYRLVDGIFDCPLNDDELFNESCSLNNDHHRFTCSINSDKKCFAPLIIQDGIRDCFNPKDEQSNYNELTENRIYFQSICDGRTEVEPILINGRNETDETDCDIWPCNNAYTRCDGIWHCKNGIDEINCLYQTCSDDEHLCVFPNDTRKISCLPITHASNGIVDCLGATDEQISARTDDRYLVSHFFQCSNSSIRLSSQDLCDNKTKCQYNDDEIFCTHRGSTGYLCHGQHTHMLTEIEKYFCDFTTIITRPKIIFFKLHSIRLYPFQFTPNIALSALPINKEIPLIQSNSVVNIEPLIYSQCHRGISIHIRISANISKLFCLCPPSYYGNQCQYQNQRVSLTLQIRATSDWPNMLTFTILLIDNEENIESHDYIEYLPIRDCQIKFNIYLLYSTRPKNSSKEYFVRIHGFNKMTLKYRGSWLFPLQFSFLPVHRLSILLKIPFSHPKSNSICQPSCIHGECFSYINQPSSTFCRCSPGWSGAQCNIMHICKCAPDSLCLSDSICVCPLGRFGPRCYLHHYSCHSKTCANRGQCLPLDERYASLHQNEAICVCPEGYSGKHCEYRQKIQIDIQFHKALSIPSSLLIHLITVHKNAEPTRTTMMKKIPFDQNSISFYTSVPFNMVFAEVFNSYYLVILQEDTIVSGTVSIQIVPSGRCAPISEVFNESVVNLHLLKRIKLYHQPCRDRLNLLCFYDSIHICLCNSARQTNCFEFNHTIKYDCQGHNLCQNGGECFQDNLTCPTLSTCVCGDCYYGSKCQFSTKGSTLSLDAILGYSIRPNITINHQLSVVKIAIILTVVIFSIGVPSNILSFITFLSERTRDVGCGIYLFTSAIISILTLSILSIKFSILLGSQIGSIKNRSILHIQCVVIDYFLRILVSSGDWFSACVAIERAVNVTKGVHFDKIKSRKIAKWIIVLTFLLTISTHLHDPIHRHLIDDEEEHRTWCVARYSSFLHTFDQMLNVVHFAIPISINFTSALIIIINATRTRSTVRKNLTYRQLLREQLEYHKHLLISPLIIIALALPRLIISFFFGCMKSARNPWFYLIGYYMSFIPPMLNFGVFVVPSKMYKKEFKDSIKRFYGSHR